MALNSGAVDRPPNIIFVLTDDQRYDEIGFVNPVIETPNMDRLAREGVHFSNAFVTTSLCSPSRASILTGMTMHNHGVVDNNKPLAPDLELFPARLRQAGYTTALVGKWHMGGESSDPRPEFDHWVSFPGQGNYYPTDMFGRPSLLNVNGEEVPQQGYITDELTDYALTWLDQLDPDRPFFLYLSHKAVHAQFQPAERHRGQYRKAEIDVGKVSQARQATAPMWVQNQKNSWHGADFPYHAEVPLTEFKREYHRTLSAVDDSIGRILVWLDKTGKLDNTVVVLMGDNGFLFGEHGLIDKRNAYEESMRVPLIAFAPDRFRPGLEVRQMVANIDIAPTFLSLAGLDVPEHYEGLSWASLAHGAQPDKWRQQLIYEYYWEFNYPQTPTTFAIRTPDYKYIQYHGVWDTEELFDLRQDPREQCNLIDDPDLIEVKMRLRRQLFDGLRDVRGEHAIAYSQKFNQGAVFRHRDRSRAAEFPDAWLRESGAPDRFEHFLPDTPAKAEQLIQMNKAISGAR
jgi:arylsulfatase A-like enzyme